MKDQKRVKENNLINEGLKPLNKLEPVDLNSITRLPHPEKPNESLVTPIRELDIHLFDDKPEIPYHFTDKEASEEYKDAIKQAADLLSQINPENEAQKKRVNFFV